MSLRQQIEEYISQNIIMQLATSIENTPFCCNLHYAFDDQLNLYWMSLQTTQHSRAIESNTKAAATIAKPHALADKPQGLQLQGTASKAEDFEQAFKIYMDRYPHWLQREEELRRGDSNGRALYKFTPSKIVLFDIANYPENPHQELSF